MIPNTKEWLVRSVRMRKRMALTALWDANVFMESATMGLLEMEAAFVFLVTPGHNANKRCLLARPFNVETALSASWKMQGSQPVRVCLVSKTLEEPVWH